MIGRFCAFILFTLHYKNACFYEISFLNHTVPCFRYKAMHILIKLKVRNHFICMTYMDVAKPLNYIGLSLNIGLLEIEKRCLQEPVL